MTARRDGWRDVAEGAIVEPVSFAMDRRMLTGIKQRAEQAGQREGDHAHGPGDSEPVSVAGPADHAEGAGRHQQAGEGEPADEPAGQDRPAWRYGRAVHEPGGGLAVSEPDGLDGQGGEAYPGEVVVQSAAGLTVLHCDKDFDFIACVTGRPALWLNAA